MQVCFWALLAVLQVEMLHLLCNAALSAAAKMLGLLSQALRQYPSCTRIDCKVQMLELYM